MATLKRLGLVAVVLAFVAYAGNSRKDTLGTAPASASDGVTLGNAVGCRCSARVDGGLSNTIGSDGFAPSGWRIVPWYFDETLGWVESQSSLHCIPAARLDAGFIRQVVCPDMEPLASFGRLSCAAYGIVGRDAGTGADLLADGGGGQLPKFRTECWGPGLSP